MESKGVYTLTESLLKLPYSEEELLQGLTPQTAHADELADLSAGELIQ